MQSPELQLDLRANREASKYPLRQQLYRVLWSVGSIAFRLSPRPCFAWRRGLLRLFGAKVGRHAHVYPSARIYMPWNLQVGEWAAIGEDAYIYNLGEVRIGDGAAISYRAHVCAGTHDFETASLPLLKVPVIVDNHAWVGTDAFLGPGVRVGYGAIVGARAVVVRDVPPLHIVAGNPARQIGTRRPSTVASQ